VNLAGGSCASEFRTISTELRHPKKLAAEVERASEHALPTCRVLIQFLVTRPAAGYSESVTQLTRETRSELGENIVQTGSPL